MHASTILLRCLSSVLEPMHLARRRVLLRAVEALVRGRRLTLTDLARSWPGATWMHAPLKALDRLLSNRHLARTVMPLHRAMAPWLLRQAQPIILVDWSDLKGDGRWCLLRASVPIGGQALTLLDRIYPIKQISTPKAQAAFLADLKPLIPVKVVPILVTDAGFRSDWFRAVLAQGWHYVGRVRNNTAAREDGARDWQPCAVLHRLAKRSPRALGPYEIVKSHPLSCRLVLARRCRQQRDLLTRCGTPQQGTTAKKARKSAREPWLLATSLPARHGAANVVAVYGQRMQIEEAFRDLKSHRYGMGFEDSLTRGIERLTVLLMLNTLAMLAAWLMASAAQPSLSRDPLARQPRHRNRYSSIRRGLEWLRRRFLPPDIKTAMRSLKIESPFLLEQAS